MGIDLGRFKSSKDKDWVDWLADDPMPEAERARLRQRAVLEASRPTVRQPGRPNIHPQSTVHNTVPKQPVENSNVSIHISIPKIKIPKPNFKIPSALLAGRRWMYASAAGIVIVAGVGLTVFLNRNDSAGQDSPAVLAEKSQTANFEYSLPKGATDGLDGTVKYDSNRQVVNFQDSIGGVALTVSQQPLPAGFEEDTAERVKKLAEDFGASQSIPEANPTAYIGTSARGPQTVVFSKKNLLVFIQSTKEIDDNDWAEYITNLQ